MLWKLWILNKIKLLGWRACHDIFPTCLNLTKSWILNDNGCPICTRVSESAIHALWDCATAQDIQVGGIKKLQKGCHGQFDMLHLMEYLMERLTMEEMKFFWIQAWFIWNQCNKVVHRGKLREPISLNKRVAYYLDKYKQS